MELNFYWSYTCYGKHNLLFLHPSRIPASLTLTTTCLSVCVWQFAQPVNRTQRPSQHLRRHFSHHSQTSCSKMCKVGDHCHYYHVCGVGCTVQWVCSFLVCWATVDWSWPKKWNRVVCELFSILIKKERKHRWGMNDLPPKFLQARKKPLSVGVNSFEKKNNKVCAGVV